MTRRISWDDYYLQIADAVSARADCTRRQAGTVIVSGNTVVATGYNGAPPGEAGCLSDGACPRGRHYRALVPGGGPAGLGGTALFGKVCACGKAWPCPDAVAPGSSYDTGKGACIAIHSEANALIRAGDRARGATLYCTSEPCEGCWRLIKGAGTARAVWYGGEWLRDTPAVSMKPWTLLLAPARNVRRLLSR